MKYCFSMLTGAFALVAAMHTGTPTVNAAPITVNTAPVENVNCVAFVDEDGDGICDICSICTGYIDEDGDGICDNWNANAGCGYGTGYIDEDGDGICDNWNANVRRGCGYGRRNGCGRRGWR